MLLNSDLFYTIINQVEVDRQLKKLYFMNIIQYIHTVYILFPFPGLKFLGHL